MEPPADSATGRTPAEVRARVARVLERLAERLTGAAEDVRELASLLAPGEAPAGPVAAPAAEASAPVEAKPAAAAVPAAPPQPVVRKVLTLGGTPTAVEVTAPAGSIVGPNVVALPEEPARPLGPPPVRSESDQLAALGERLLLQSQAWAWQVAQRGMSDDERSRTFKALVIRAKEEIHTFTWGLHPGEGPRRTPEQAQLLSETFAAAAEAAALLSEFRSSPGRPDRPTLTAAIDLGAEAQSMLMEAVRRAGLKADADQVEFFGVLRDIAAREQWYVRRHLSMTDPADPSLAAGLVERIGSLRRRALEARESRKRVEKSLSKLRYHAGRVRDGHAEDAPRLHALFDSAADDTRLDPEALGEAIEDLLDVLSESGLSSERAQALLAEARAEAEARDEDAAGRAPTAEVARVRAWLEGREAVLICGQRYAHAADRIERAFGLRALRWPTVLVHQKADFYADISASEVKVVLVAIRLVSHMHSELAAEQARDAGRPLVRLTHGYSVNQIARAIVEQAGDRMG
ncbi:MAG: hypothetical protein IBJ11_07510 [Phycisphaerales bacterium]|nr:hypothetical protein [Phycisphaerales bacterium]